VIYSEITEQITFLDTLDLEATGRFYQDILGLPLVLDQGGCRIYRVSRDGLLGFCQRDQVSEPAGIIFTIVTPDVDGWYHRLRDRGVAFVKTPAVNEDYQIYHCFLRDPNGYLIEIQRFLDPDWRVEAPA